MSRITSLSLSQAVAATLQTQQSRLAALQEQQSSGLRVSKASDDPAATAQLLTLKNQQRANTQYARNATNADSWLGTADGALTTASSTLRRARDLVVQSGSGSTSPASRQALAAEIQGLRDQLLSTANSQYAGRSVFAGTSSADTAFDTSTYAFNGSSTATVARQVGPSTSIRVDVDGSSVFGNGSNSVFGLLDSISATLKSGGDVTGQLSAIDGYATKITDALSGVGAAENAVTAAQSQLSSSSVTLTSQVSDLQEVDIAQTYLQIQTQQVAYQAALSSAAKLLQTNLLEFLS